MPILCWNAAALTIAVTFYVWRDGIVGRIKREKTLRERIAYMLWVAANQAA
ncbi:MAG: hypothetical protein ACJ8F7_06440 [Gemmataceae bacterium]